MATTDKLSNVSSLFSEISGLSKAGEYEKALRICSKILQENAEDVDAFHCKVVCMIQMEKFDDALKQIHKNASLARGALFEKAYCEYRLNQINEACKTLSVISQPDTRTRELLAQVLYRQEKYEECCELYKDVIKNSEDSYEDERQTNLAAVLAAVNKENNQCDIEKPEDIGVKEDTYETVYNLACYYLSIKDVDTAIQKLEQAERLCREMLEDEAEEDTDVSAEELDAELALIRVQKGYALQLQGKNDAAMKLYNLVAKQRPTEVALVAVTANNIVTINKEQNVFDSKKRMRIATGDNVKHKLNSQQKLNIAMNNCLLLLYMNQFEECRKNLKLLVTQHPSCSKTAMLIEAAVYVREKQTTKAVALLGEFISESNEFDLLIILTLAQLHLQQGSISQACKTLEKIVKLTGPGNSSTYKSGIISTLVTLYTHLEDRETAECLLTEAVKWHRQKMTNSPQSLVLMKECAQYMMRNVNYKEAAKVLEEIRKLEYEHSSSNQTLAQLIAAYSHFDTDKMHKLAADLPTAQQMAATVDVDTLENTGMSVPGRFAKKDKRTDSPGVKTGASLSTDGSVSKQKKHKRKKKVLPKNYDPNVDPDPERWLPRWERSTYHGRKKRDKRRGGGADVGKGTQGASALVMAELDASAQPGAGKSLQPPGSPQAGPSSPSSSSATASTSVPGPRQQKPGASKQKKKKKGGNKW